jgi:hypothetical protein
MSDIESLDSELAKESALGRMFDADPSARAAYERGQQAERERLEAIQQKALESLRTFGEFRDEGLLWLINTSVFHPRGFAIAFVLSTERHPCDMLTSILDEVDKSSG